MNSPNGKGKGSPLPGLPSFDLNAMTKKQQKELYATINNKLKGGRGATGPPPGHKWKTHCCKFVMAGTPWECPHYQDSSWCPFGHTRENYDDQGNVLDGLVWPSCSYTTVTDGALTESYSSCSQSSSYPEDSHYFYADESGEYYYEEWGPDGEPPLGDIWGPGDWTDDSWQWDPTWEQDGEWDDGTGDWDQDVEMDQDQDMTGGLEDEWGPPPLGTGVLTWPTSRCMPTSGSNMVDPFAEAIMEWLEDNPGMELPIWGKLSGMPAKGSGLQSAEVLPCQDPPLDPRGLS